MGGLFWGEEELTFFAAPIKSLKLRHEQKLKVEERQRAEGKEEVLQCEKL